MTRRKDGNYSERQIVNHIIKNWDSLFEEGIKYQGREKEWIRGWRNDITSYVEMELGEEYGYLEKPHNFKAPIFIEVKYKSDSRDLLYELKKALTAVSRFKPKTVDGKEYFAHPAYIGVISDDFSDEYIYDFIVSHGIHMWQIKMDDDDIETLRLNYIEHYELEVKDIL
jgi:hypothetical protein